MRRVIVPAVLALAFFAGNAQDASAFGHLKSLFGGGCDTCCDTHEPVCGCEPIMCEPVCGCEPVCHTPAPKCGLLQKLFGRKSSCCDVPACEPVCGCEPIHTPICEPVCGCEPVCEPVCCDAGPRRTPVKDFFRKLFHKHSHGCDACCDVIEPACGCEPTCGIEPSCGCGF